MVLKIQDYEAVNVFTGNNVEIGLYRKDEEYIIYRYAARGKIKNFVSNYEFIDENNVSQLLPMDIEHGSEIIKRVET